MRDPWRIDHIGDGPLAWLYVVPHAVDWQTPAAEVETPRVFGHRGIANVVDDQFGGCLRYLVVIDAPSGHSTHEGQNNSRVSSLTDG